MFYRIAVGVGLFVLGYVLGRGMRHPVLKPEYYETSRIRDTLSADTEVAAEGEGQRGAETKSDQRSGGEKPA